MPLINAAVAISASQLFPLALKVHKRILCTFLLLPTFLLANSSDSHLLHTTILLMSMPPTFPKPATHFPTLSGGNLSLKSPGNRECGGNLSLKSPGNREHV